MWIVLNPEVKRIKNAYSATSTELRLTAHGWSPDAAKMSLERSVRIFFAGFERFGTLREEVKIAGVFTEDDDGAGLNVRCV